MYRPESLSGPHTACTNKRGIFKRLDYLITDTTTMERVTHHEIIATARSDHRIVVAHIALDRQRITGRGLWRHNDATLGEDEYCKMIEGIIETEKQAQMSNKQGPSHCNLQLDSLSKLLMYDHC